MFQDRTFTKKLELDVAAPAQLLRSPRHDSSLLAAGHMVLALHPFLVWLNVTGALGIFMALFIFVLAHTNHNALLKNHLRHAITRFFQTFMLYLLVLVALGQIVSAYDYALFYLIFISPVHLVDTFNSFYHRPLLQFAKLPFIGIKTP